MIPGSIAGCVEHMTRMQALGSCPIKSSGVGSAFRSILHMDGSSGIYGGIVAGPAHALYFTVYEFSKRELSNRNMNPHLAHAAPGVSATVLSDAVFTPMDMVKQRLQLNGGGVSGAYRGVWDCVKRVSREEGFRAFYASYRTTVIMNSPFTAVHVRRHCWEFNRRETSLTDQLIMQLQGPQLELLLLLLPHHSMLSRLNCSVRVFAAVTDILMGQ